MTSNRLLPGKSCGDRARRRTCSLSCPLVNGHIVAIGGGTFLTDDPDPRLDAFILALAGKRAPERLLIWAPRAATTIAACIAFYRAMSDARLPSHRADASSSAWSRTSSAFVAEQDVFWVGGGSTANLLAVWRLHGLDELLRAAYARGAVLCRRLGGDELLVRGLDDGLVRADAGAAARRARLPGGLVLPALRRRTSSGGRMYRGAGGRAASSRPG